MSDICIRAKEPSKAAIPNNTVGGSPPSGSEEIRRILPWKEGFGRVEFVLEREKTGQKILLGVIIKCSLSAARRREEPKSSLTWSQHPHWLKIN